MNESDAFSKEDFDYVNALLLRYVRERVLPNYKSEVEDLVSEAFLRLVKTMRRMSLQGTRIASMEAFARTVATQTCRDFFRKVNSVKYVEARELPEIEDYRRTPEQLVDDPDFVNNILDSNFTGLDLVIARLMFVAEVREICEVTGLAPATVYRQQKLILSRLAEIGEMFDKAPVSEVGDSDGV